MLEESGPCGIRIEDAMLGIEEENPLAEVLEEGVQVGGAAQEFGDDPARRDIFEASELARPCGRRGVVFKGFQDQKKILEHRLGRSLGDEGIGPHPAEPLRGFGSRPGQDDDRD